MLHARRSVFFRDCFKSLSFEDSTSLGTCINTQNRPAAVKCILEQMSQALATGERIEIRGFGSFSLHYRPPRKGRNPKTGDAVALTEKYAPHFKPGKELRNRVNSGL